jgi:hypothetical protein
VKRTFIHRFKDGRVASQIYELDFKARTCRFIRWEFSHPDVTDRLPVGECKKWVDEVNRHFSTIGFKPALAR